MKFLKLFFKNAFRHKLRTFLTIIGIAIAVLAFGVLQTVISAWHAGVEAASADRLMTRHSVSFIFPLNYSYRDKIANVPGVTNVSYANWFGGVYIDKNQFFARLAIDSETFFDVYPELEVSPEHLAAFQKERNACIIGADLVERYNLKIGDAMNIEGDIYPGTWEFVIRGIYKPRNKSADGSQMLFHWNYLNQTMEAQSPNRANFVGWYVVEIDDPNNAANISQDIDAVFANSPAKTKTETERAFQQGFLSSSGAILTAINIMSFLIVGIIMLVVGNTMIMSARERTREYAVFKALGFSGKHLTAIIMGESLFISILGGIIGLALTMPLIDGFSAALPAGWFPVFQMAPSTMVILLVAIFFIGIVAAIFPIQRALSTKIIDGFRFVG